MPSEDLTSNELANLIGQLCNQRKELQQRLDELDKQLEAVETTVHLLRYGKSGRSYTDKSLISELRGKTHIDALLTIAGKNNNRLKATEAKRLMIEAGLIRNPKTALSMLYTIINRSGKFERVRPGEYRLIDVQQSLLG